MQGQLQHVRSGRVSDLARLQGRNLWHARPAPVTVSPQQPHSPPAAAVSTTLGGVCSHGPLRAPRPSSHSASACSKTHWCRCQCGQGTAITLHRRHGHLRHNQSLPPPTSRPVRHIPASAASGPWDTGGLPQSPGSAPSLPARAISAMQQFLMSALSPVLNWIMLYRDILQRILLTVAMLTVFRCGLYIALPGLDFGLLPAPPDFTEGERLVRALYGQARALPASLFELGISPYINASILITLVLALPEQAVSWGPLTRLREARKEGRAGQAYITSILNWLALFFSVYLALVKAIELQPYAVAPGAGFLPLTAMALVAGSAIIQHCASIITAHGIGNGSSLVICCGIITDYAEALHAVFSRLEAGAIAPTLLASLGATYGLLALVAVYISRTELRLPILQYSRGSTGGPQPMVPNSNHQDNEMAMFSAARRQAEIKMARRVARAEYFPIPINGSGMMSIILAGAFWFFMIPAGAQFCGLTGLYQTLLAMQSSWTGLAIYALLVFAVEFLPLGGINPKDVAEYFNAMNVGIKGVVPGEPTEQYVQRQLLLCKFWGGIALGCLAVAAHVFDSVCLATLGCSLSATSLLIIVGTVIQSSRQVESLLEAPQLNSQLQKEQGLIKSLANL